MAPSRKTVDAVFRALAHEGRRRLLTALHERAGSTLGELADVLPMSRQAVSQHLTMLERADLVVTRWRGREKLHYLNAAPLADVYAAFVEPLVTAPARALVALRDEVEADVAQPGRRPARTKKKGA